MNIPLSKLNYSFTQKPLLVGGLAMEYYGLRKAGKDIDLIARDVDVVNLIKLYPDRVKDLWGDLGVCPHEFEIWKSICLFDYEDLKEGAIEEEQVYIISLEKLLLMKAYGMKIEKYLEDARLVVDKILKNQFDNYPQVNMQNEKFLQSIKDISYIEKRGSKE